MRAFFYTLLGFSVVAVFLFAAVHYPEWLQKPENPSYPADLALSKPPPPPPAESRPSSMQMIQKEPGLAQSPPKEVDWASSYRYETMRKIADAARDNRPDLYADFISQKSLSDISERYAQDKDFAAFLRALDAAPEFGRLLFARKNSREMRKFVAALFATPPIGGPLNQVFSEFAANPDLQDLARGHGWDLGLPPEIMAQLGIAQPTPKRKPKLRRFKPGNNSISPTRIQSSFQR